MDVKHAPPLTRFAGSLLALATVCGAAFADDAIVMGGSPSTIVIGASDAGADVQLPPAAAASTTELKLHAGDGKSGQRPAASASAAPAGNDLSVIANSAQKKPLSAIIIDPQVVPAAAHTRVASRSSHSSPLAGVFSGGPSRPNPAAGIQSRQNNRYQENRYQTPDAPPQKQPSAPAKKTIEQPQRSTPPRTSHSAPSKSAPAPAKNQQSAVPQPRDPASRLLLQAYDLSLRANEEVEFSQVVRGCAEAMRLGLDAESRQFAVQLSAWSLNRRGLLRADHDQRELALVDFRAALDFDPKCWRAFHNRSVTLAQKGQFAEAFDDCCKVIALNPQFAKAYSNRGTLYVQAGDIEKALADYDAALQLDPNLSQALVGRARVFHLSGRLEEALAGFDAAINQEQVSAEIVCSRGDLLADLGRYGDALQDYARAIDLDPKFEHAYRNGAWLLATCPDDHVRDADGALKGAQAALDCGYGERHAALDTLAAALANAGRYEEAVGTIQQAIEIAPEEARSAYQARQQLYESRQPFRTHPVSNDSDVQTAEFIEAKG